MQTGRVTYRETGPHEQSLGRPESDSGRSNGLDGADLAMGACGARAEHLQGVRDHLGGVAVQAVAALPLAGAQLALDEDQPTLVLLDFRRISWYILAP